MFNSAISTIILILQKIRFCLLNNMEKDFNVLVAGYIIKGENAKEKH